MYGDVISITIITVCLNAGGKLHKTVDSVLEQTYPDWYLIVKDGKSTDGSIEKIAKDKRIEVIIEEDNGIYSAMNQGLKKVKKGYVLFLNAGDTFAANDVLAKFAEFAIFNNEPEIIYGDYINSLGDKCVIPDKITKSFLFHSFLCHQSVFYKRELLNGYDESFKLLADHDQHINLLVVKKKTFSHIPIAICQYEGGGISENKKYRCLHKREQHILQRKYYTRMEIVTNTVRYNMTLPFIRKFLYGANSPKIVRKIYRKIVTLIRENRG